jgi:predicted O-methyltransferase YrrM
MHQRAFQRLLLHVGDAKRIAIVGGALFPRTALVLKEVAPQADVTVIDSNERHIQIAHQFLNGTVR